MSNFVLQIVLKVNADQPWFTNILRKLYNRKKCLFAKAKKTSLGCAFQKYSNCLRDFKCSIKKAKDKFFKQDLHNLLTSNPRKLWNIICARKDDSFPKLCH